MNFWIRNIIIGSILIVLAGVLLLNQDLLFSLGGEETPAEAPADLSEVVEEKEEVSITVNKPKKANAAADGLSRFYANLHGDVDEGGLKVRNNMVYLPDPKGNLVEILEARRLVTRPLRKNWKGVKGSFPFRKGETLLQKLSEYAEKEKLQVIWWLNRDYIVKDPFRVEKNIVDTAYQAGRAVQGHFSHGLSTYFCYKHRSIVLIENELDQNANAYDYLNAECTLQKSKSGY